MRKRSDGFTLVELMVVVLVIGILVAVAVPVFTHARDEAEWNTCQANQRTLLGVFEAYRAAEGSYPDLTAGSGGTDQYRTLFVSDMRTSGRMLIPTYLKTYPVCPKARRLWNGQIDRQWCTYLILQHTTEDRHLHIDQEASGGGVPGGWTEGHSSLSYYQR